MATRVLMPKGSDTMTEGKVLKWLKKEGDVVESGDALVEIETDKVDMEVEAMGAGVLRKVLVDAGQAVPVGAVLGVIAKPDEDIAALVEKAGPVSAAAKAAPASAVAAPAPKSGVSSGATSLGSESANLPAPTAPGRVTASPLARKMARDAGLNLAGVPGSGPSGRIVRRDIEAAVAAGGAPGSRAIPGAPLRVVVPRTGPEFTDEPLGMMRKTIAQRLSQSLGPVPHFYLTIEADMRRAKDLRASASQIDPNLKLSYNDIILKACAAALVQYPAVNVAFMGESLRHHNRVHIGIAVAVEGGGLITPVLRDADRKSLQEISAEVKDLVGRARQRKLKPEEYTGSTFSVSNLGMMGIDEFSAIINPPEAAILAVGAVAEKPVINEGRIETGVRCRMTLSCDHRAVDGAIGATFLQTLREILENPVFLAF